MDLGTRRGKLLAVGWAAFVVAAVAAVAVASLGSETHVAPAADPVAQPNSPPPQAASSEFLAADCDRLAATPGDPMRTVAPVHDDQFAPATALSACERAVDANPDNARLQFQLGRALWLSGRFGDAFEPLKKARLGGHKMASLFLGNAFRDNHLPDGQVPNIRTAITLYREASEAGIEMATRSLEEAEHEAARLTFDKSLFQNGDYLEAIYNNDYSNIRYTARLAFYMQGLAHGFEDTNVVFIDQRCRSLLSQLGVDILNIGSIPAIIVELSRSKDPNGNFSVQDAMQTALSVVASDYIRDQGARDATILYNESGRYGCASPVTQQILKNMVLVIRNSSR